MERPQPAQSRWPQRWAVLFCVGMVGALWFASQSTWALSNRVEGADGWLVREPTAPEWIRDVFGEGVASFVDTPKELYLREEVPEGVLPRAAEVETLEWLVLDDTKVTDADLAPFESHPNLKGVRLQGTRITDRTLKVLASLPSLRTVTLTRTRVSPEGIAAFRKAKPKVEIGIDAATEVGLQPYVESKRLFFNNGSGGVPTTESSTAIPGGLTVRGPLESGLVDAAGKLTINDLRLEDLTITDEIDRLVKGQPIENISLERVELTAVGAAAFAECPLKRLQMREVRIDAGAARSLARLSLDALWMSDVEFAEGEAQGLSGLEATQMNISGDLHIAPEDRFENLRVQRLGLHGVVLPSKTPLFTESRIPQLQARYMTLDASTASRLAAVPTKSLSFSFVSIAGNDPSWITSCGMSSLRIEQQHLSRRELEALAALPLDTLTLSGVTLEPGSDALFADFNARSLKIDQLTVEQARALAGSELEELVVYNEILESDVLLAIGEMSQLETLNVKIQAVVRKEALESVADLPNLKKWHLNMVVPMSVSDAYWPKLAARRPALDLTVDAVGSAYRRIWPPAEPGNEPLE